MPALPKKKVGLISCSGEDLAEGTVTRQATLRVLEELRPGDTVTLCLPLFLAGEERERAFARYYPTITIDGCDKRCAARAAARFSAPPAAGLVVTDFVKARGLPQPAGARSLDEAGREVAEALAQVLAEEVDLLLGKRRTGPVATVAPEDAGLGETATAPAVSSCACGSGIPVGRVTVDGRVLELVALPSIFRLLRGLGRAPADVGDELMELVRVYNAGSAGDDGGLRQAVLREYAAFCDQRAD